MNRKQWIFLILLLIFLVLFVFNLVEYQKTDKAIGALLGMLSSLIFIIAMGILIYYNKKK